MGYTLKKLSVHEKTLYVKGCPVIMPYGILYKINETDELVIQLKFKNIGNKIVKAIKVAIDTFDTAGNVVDENIFHQYLDLAVSTNQEYSDRKGLFLTNNTVRSFNVKVVEIVFADGVVWRGNEAPERLSKQRLEEKLSGELVLQYGRELGTSAKYVPFEYKDVWCCTCGNYNHINNSSCLRCKRKKDKQFYFFDEDVLIEKKRLHDEEKAQLEAKRQKEKQATIEKTKKFAKIVLPTVFAIVVLIVLINNVIIPSSKYRSAVKLMNNEYYNKAIAIFRELDDYKDSEAQIDQCRTAIKEKRYNNALQLMNDEKYDKAITIFKELNGYKDSKDQIDQCNYNKALQLMKDKEYDEAIAIFTELEDYKDSEEQVCQCEISALKTAKVGDYVYFGLYEQDNDTTNGKENIEWLVLENKNNKLLIISKYALDCQPYNKVLKSVTWETCSLRKWLNNEFINEAFSKKEQKYIPTVTVPAHKNPKYDTDPGKATKDKVFLLSAVEAEKYFSSDSERQCMTTNHVDANGAYVDSNGYSYWLLRSPGIYSSYCCIVDYDGYVIHGYGVNRSYYGIRPALWINIPS